MHLRVITQTTNRPTRKQCLSAYYNADKKYTVVNCDLDIVTLGLTINILQQQYDEALKALDADLATRVRETTRKAAMIK